MNSKTQKINELEIVLNKVVEELNKLEKSPFYWRCNKMDYVYRRLFDHEIIDLINIHGKIKINGILKKDFSKKHAENKKTS